MSKDTLEKLIETNLMQLMDRRGIIIDGYPRHMDQVQEFEDKVILLLIIEIVKLLQKYIFSSISINKSPK